MVVVVELVGWWGELGLVFVRWDRDEMSVGRKYKTIGVGWFGIICSRK